MFNLFTGLHVRTPVEGWGWGMWMITVYTLPSVIHTHTHVWIAIGRQRPWTCVVYIPFLIINEKKTINSLHRMVTDDGFEARIEDRCYENDFPKNVQTPVLFTRTTENVYVWSDSVKCDFHRHLKTNNDQCSDQYDLNTHTNTQTMTQ